MIPWKSQEKIPSLDISQTYRGYAEIEEKKTSSSLSKFGGYFMEANGQ